MTSTSAISSIPPRVCVCCIPTVIDNWSDEKDDPVTEIIPSNTTTVARGSVPIKTVMRTLTNSLAHGSKRGKGSSNFRNTKPFKSKLWTNLSQASSAAATGLSLAVTWTLNSTNFPEFVPLQTLFDELKVVGGTLHYNFDTAVSSAAVPTNVVAGCAISFDPSVAAPSTIVTCLQQSYHSPPLMIGCNTGVQTPDPMTMRTIRFKMPNPIAPITSSDNPGSAWIVLDGVTAPSLCTIMVASAAYGAAGVCRFSMFLELDIELKIRA